jgi:hypothetical protein
VPEVAAWIQANNLLRSPPFRVDRFGLYSSWRTTRARPIGWKRSIRWAEAPAQRASKGQGGNIQEQRSLLRFDRGPRQITVTLAQSETCMSLYLFALLIGVVAGLRAMTAPAAVAWGAHLG